MTQRRLTFAKVNGKYPTNPIIQYYIGNCDRNGVSCTLDYIRIHQKEQVLT